MLTKRYVYGRNIASYVFITGAITVLRTSDPIHVYKSDFHENLSWVRVAKDTSKSFKNNKKIVLDF